MDKICIQNQKYVNDNKINSIESRENMIKARKAEKNKELIIIDDEGKKWQIEIVEDSGAIKEVEEIDVKKRDELSMEQLMAQMKQL